MSNANKCNTEKTQKILIIQNQIPPYRVPFFEALGKYYDITVLFFSGDPGVTEFKKIKYDGRMYRLKQIRYTPGVYRIAKEFDCVVIMFDLWWLNLSILPFQLNSRRTRSVLWGHGIGRTNGVRVAALLRRLIAAKANALIFYINETKAIFRNKTGIQDAKCFVANNTMLVKQIAREMPAQQRNCFLYLGRLQQRKKIDVLLRAYAQLSAAQRQACQLMIVGSGDTAITRDLQQLSLALDVADTVEFRPGTFDEDCIEQYYSTALAYVSPGAVGLGVVQSFAYGVPVVTAANINHGPEFAYCNHDNSYLYMHNEDDEAATIEQLKCVMLQVVNNREQWLQKALAAQHTYSHECSMEKMLNGFADAIAY